MMVKNGKNDDEKNDEHDDKNDDKDSDDKGDEQTGSRKTPTIKFLHNTNEKQRGLE